MCIMEHACLIRRDEVYLARIPHRSAGADRRGLLLLAAFPLLSPLSLPHPPSFTLSTVWNSFPSGCSHHHISILLTQPSFSVVWQASVLPSFSSLSVFVSCWWSRRQGISLQEGGLFAPDLLSGEVSVCVSSWSAWDCGASLMQVTPSGAATGQRTESCLHVWMCFVLRADWREKTGGSNRGRKACSKRRTSDRGFGEVGAGSAESASKVKGGSPLTLKRKKWKKGGCFLLRLRGCRESGESGAPQTLWHCNQSPGADWDTEVVNDTEGGVGSGRTSSLQRWAYIWSGARTNEEHPCSKFTASPHPKNLQKDPIMAVQLMPESAICLLMVSLGGNIVFPELSPFCLYFFFFFTTVLLAFCLSLSSQGRSRALISLKGMLLVFSPPLQQAENPRITFQQGSEATLTTLWIYRSVWRTSSQEWRRVWSAWLFHEIKVIESMLLPVCPVMTLQCMRGLYQRDVPCVCAWNAATYMTTIMWDHFNPSLGYVKYILPGFKTGNL